METTIKGAFYEQKTISSHFILAVPALCMRTAGGFSKKLVPEPTNQKRHLVREIRTGAF